MQIPYYGTGHKGETEVEPATLYALVGQLSLTIRGVLTDPPSDTDLEVAVMSYREPVEVRAFTRCSSESEQMKANRE